MVKANIKFIFKVLNVVLNITLFCTLSLWGQSEEAAKIKEDGKFENWRREEVTESKVLGGNTKTLYRFDNKESTYFTPTNVVANIIGIIKTSNQVFQERRGDGYCARLEVVEEVVKVAGMINLRVVAQGSVITGELYEPIRDTKSPYSKLDYGIPFTDMPKGLKYDYKAIVGNPRVRGTGLSPRKLLGDPDYADIVVLLQKRWENEDGSISAKRVGTAYKRITESVTEWVNSEVLEIKYGDITLEEGYKDYMGLRSKGSEIENFARNSKGESVKIDEVGWGEEGDTPTHIIIWLSASDGKAFYGGIGNTLWIDNVELLY